MIRDPLPPAGGETDTELSALFATLKDDRAPADVEARLLAGLSMATAASAGAAAAKATLWKKLGLWLATHGLARAVVVGVLSGSVVCGVIVVVDAPEGKAVLGATGVERGPTARPAAAPVEDNGARGSGGPEVRSASSVTAPGRAGAPKRDRKGPGVAGAASSAFPALSSSPAPMRQSGAVATSTSAGVAGGGADGPAVPRGTTGASDGLPRELSLVRGIAALVDAGRCPEARAAIAAYRRENPAGQLSGEVDVLAERCRAP